MEAKRIFRRSLLQGKYRIQQERPSFSAQGFYALGLLKGIEKMRRKIQSLPIICLLVFGSFLLMVGLISQNAEAASSQVSATTVGEAFQTWEIVDEGGQTATLTVDSSGNFTGTGWFGYAPGCDNYDIHITNGRMSGTSMIWGANASYCSGQGIIEANGIGTLLDVSFPGATSATGKWSGTISDPLGTRSFTSSWTATRLSCAPVAKFTKSIEGNVVVFDASTSYDPDGGIIVNYIWDFEGGEPQGEPGKKAYVLYSVSGLHKVKLTVVDDEGEQGSTESELAILVKGDEIAIVDFKEIKTHARKASIGIRVAQGICGALDTLSDFAVATRSEFGFVIGIAKVIKGTLSLSPMGIVEWIVEKVAKRIVKRLLRTWCNGIDANSKLAEDPPDSNYSEVAEIEPFETFPAEGETSMEVAMVTLTNSMTENQAILSVLTTSIERFQGALLAGEDEYILLQARAVRDYSDTMVENLKNMNDSFSELIREIELLEYDPNLSADLLEMQLRLLMEGFTQEEVEYFKTLGATDSDIEAYEEMLLDFDISSVREQFEQLQSIFEEGVAVYADLSAQASNIIGLLSGLQGDVNGDDVVDIFDLALTWRCLAPTGSTEITTIPAGVTAPILMIAER